MPVNEFRIIQDILWFIKNHLNDQTELTDPISASRPGDEAWIMTSYPSRPVRYPIITIKDLNQNTLEILGLRSEALLQSITMEMRVWGRNVAERDRLADQLFSVMRRQQIDAIPTSSVVSAETWDLHDFKLLSAVNVDEVDGPKSKVLTVEYKYVATGGA